MFIIEDYVSGETIEVENQEVGIKVAEDRIKKYDSNDVDWYLFKGYIVIHGGGIK